MPSVKDNIICLRTQNFSESSQILTLFARSYGKLRLIAKGSRRRRNKFVGPIDLLNVGDIVFYPPRRETSLATLAEFKLQKTFNSLRNKLLPMNCAQYAAGLVADFTADADPHEQLYFSLLETLDQLQNSPRPEALLLQFELVLFQQVGLSPNWKQCVNCDKSLPPEQRLYFTSQGGGMLCRECEPAAVEKRFMEPPALQLLQNPQNALNSSMQVVVEAHELLSYHQRELLNRENSLTKFVNQLLRKELKKSERMGK
jgi:DNA repair protein RecO (recombination protein O)